ncbi:cation:proton antiporter [Fangia hongkongensis]|uniref:cation:proton antiporter n=1 Tax=Fangia hongkongensis TaxID=270495 RepID=UPI000365E705|nr:cation:proton antiporter [Fangia hongkongensis]MBK2125499.1 cation:proton antiporter [Fangia hongkongensis]
MHGLLFVFFLVFFGASVFATLALYTRQAIIVAYIALGLIVGPHCLGLISNVETVHEISDIGIMFLLFLLGLNLEIKSMIQMLRKALFVSITSSVIFIIATVFICHLFGIGAQGFIIGAALIFSSTIICLKMLPTTALHHKRIGELVIAILLIQDLVAILMLTLISLWSSQADNIHFFSLIKLVIALPVLAGLGYLAQRYFLFKLFRRFNRFKEYIFLLSIGWCLGMAQLAVLFGLSTEIGAFIAGVTIASSPIAKYIYENLKPLRDFFLILFFFSVGAGFNLAGLPEVWGVVIVLTLVTLLLKPLLHFVTLWMVKEPRNEAFEIGVRLGQGSEFSLLLITLAASAGIATTQSEIIVEAVSILTFIVSSYIVMFSYPSPIAVSDRLRRD